MDPAHDRQMPAAMLPLDEAAARLDLKPETLRKALAAGRRQGEKRDGRWWAWVPADAGMDAGTAPGTTGTDTGMVPAAMLARVEAEVAFLRAELDARTEETRRLHHLLAGLIERVGALPATTAADAPQDAIYGPRTGGASADGSQVPATAAAPTGLLARLGRWLRGAG
jgi:hypothetical protein